MSRLEKKLDKRAKELLIKSGMVDASEFEKLDGHWVMYQLSGCWEYQEYDEVSPWGYLYRLVCDACVSMTMEDDDSEIGYHIEYIEKIKFNESIIDTFRIFKSEYMGVIEG
jgi:hypothetical protein